MSQLRLMKVSDLAPNPKNPRTISDAKLAQLKKSLLEFGDLSCIIYNQTLKQLESGNQRAKNLKNAKVIYTKKYSKPTKTGTVAEGYVRLNGERFRYREVQWDKARALAANLAANKNAGDWDFSRLSEQIQELNGLNFDMDLTMFDEHEIERITGGAGSPKTGATELSEDDFQEFQHTCPKCSFQWN